MQRFFLEVSLWETQMILQNEDIMYQLITVLRVRKWDKVIFYNQQDRVDYVYQITSIDKKNIIFSLIQELQKLKEKIYLVLFQSLPNKIDKIEEIIQKGTEVGYSEFCFFRADRSQELKLSPNKIQRFKKIIKEASEQSQRNIVPKLYFLEKLDVSKISWEKVYFHTESQASEKLLEITFDIDKNINIFIWPEGGFSPKENEKFQKENFRKIYLGNNILRTENTPIVVWFSILQKYF